MSQDAPKTDLELISQAINKRFSRRQIAHRLGCSIAQVQKWERLGQLTPIRGDGSRVWFAAEEVDEIERNWKPKRLTRRDRKKLGIEPPSRAYTPSMAELRYKGEMAQKCFELFARNAPFREVVIKTGCAPSLVRELYEEWSMSFEQSKKVKEKQRLELEEKQAQREHDQRRAKDDFWSRKRELAIIASRK